MWQQKPTSLLTANSSVIMTEKNSFTADKNCKFWCSARQEYLEVQSLQHQFVQDQLIPLKWSHILSKGQIGFVSVTIRKEWAKRKRLVSVLWFSKVSALWWPRAEFFATSQVFVRPRCNLQCLCCNQVFLVLADRVGWWGAGARGWAGQQDTPKAVWKKCSRRW